MGGTASDASSHVDEAFFVRPQAWVRTMNVDEWQLPEAVRAAGASYQAALPELVERTIQIQQIPAPSGQEQRRADWVETRMGELGLADVSQDPLFNVYGRAPGEGDGPALLISAHLDTVFPRETDLSVRRDSRNGLIFGPGIGDNSVAVAALLTLAETLKRLPAPPVDIWLVANSNEEGLGDLRGMRAVVDRLGSQVGAAIVLEGMGLGRIVHRGLGVRRYRIRATAPGGHSWGDFGAGSAIHALVQLAADISRLQMPEQVRTTFNIGRIQGGRSVNTIAQEASLELDLRSEAPSALNWLIGQVQLLVRRHQAAHNQERDNVRFHVEEIGNRPAGAISEEHPLVQALMAILEELGVTEEPELRISSTDANVPLSRGIPAVCIGLTEGGDAHRLSEWIDPRPLPQGMQQLLYLTWWAAQWLGGALGDQPRSR